MIRCLSPVLLLIALVLAPGTSRAAESYDNCVGFITSLPAVLSTQGVWCMDGDLSSALTSGQLIQVNANNITIDCNGFKLGGLAAGPTTLTTAILAVDKLNTTIRNCNVRGFYAGIALSGGGGHLVEDNRLDGNTRSGIIVMADGSTVRRNQVFDTGNQIDDSEVQAIFAFGQADILDNSISGVSSDAGAVYGIRTSAMEEGVVAGNRIRGLSAPPGGAVGIAMFSNGNVHIDGNHLLRNAADAAVNALAIGCASAAGKARNNTITGYTADISTCTDIGGNQ